MKKGYWISAHRKTPDPVKAQAYKEIAMPAIKAAGGRFIVAGVPEVREFGIAERIVVIEFPSFDAAKACYDDNEEYKKALEVVGDGYERDLRIVEGLEED